MLSPGNKVYQTETEKTIVSVSKSKDVVDQCLGLGKICLGTYCIKCNDFRRR